jgi:broad specificity phosphatase PhoE
MKNIYFVRHGETNYNLKKLCNGSGNDVFLTNKGKQQAQELGSLIKSKKLTFDLIVSSGIPRVTETLKIIFDGQLPKYQIDDRIGDTRTGFDGRPVQEFIDFVAADPVYTRHTNGESFFDVYQRCLWFLEDIAKIPESNILVVTHRNVIKAVKMNIEKIPLTEVETVPTAGNCEIYQVIL